MDIVTIVYFQVIIVFIFVDAIINETSFII